MFHVIPAIDIIDGRCVRLEQGDYRRETVYPDSPLEMAKVWTAHNANLIHIVDLDGARTGRIHNLEVVSEICRGLSCPCELGGGLRTRQDIERVLNAGVSRVVFGTVLAENPELAGDFVNEFGADKIVAGLDARNGKVATQGWQENTAGDIFELANILVDHGITRFIYTDIATDGMFTGPNLETVGKLCDSVASAMIIASGGVGSGEDVRDLVKLRRPNLEGVIVGKALYDGRVSYDELSSFIRND